MVGRSTFGAGVLQLNPYLLFLFSLGVLRYNRCSWPGHGFKSLMDAGILGVASATSRAVLRFLGAYASSLAGTDTNLLMEPPARRLA